MRLSGIDIDDTSAVLRIPEPVSIIPPGTFDSNRNIRHMELPGTLVSIGMNAFRRCGRLAYAEIPEGVTGIGDFAFANCPNLKHVVLPSTLDSAGVGIFYGCDSLSTITVRPGGRFSVVNGMLYDTLEETVVSSPASVKCPVLPENTVGIADYAFGKGLLEITMARRPQTIGPHSIPVETMNGFYVGSSGEPSPVLTDCAGKVLLRCCARIGTVTIPEGIERIHEGAFTGCRDVTGLILPSTLRSSYDALFRDLKSLKRLHIPEGMSADIHCTLRDTENDPLEAPRNGIFIRFNGRSEMWNPKADGFVLWDPAAGDPPEYIPHSEIGSGDLPPVRKPGDGKHPGREHVPGMESMFKPVDVKGTTLDSIAGQETAKRIIRERMVLPAQHPELFERYRMEPAVGILMYGPPGTGKTMLARAVACEIGADFFSVTPSDILAKYVGDSEKIIAELFRTASESEKAVIFFDDFDSIGRKRGNDREPWQTDTINELLTQIQGLKGRNGGIHLIAATNRPWDIDSALVRSGRFSVHVHVSLPDADAREHILRTALEGVPVGDADLGRIARMTEGYNGADMKEIADNAKMARIIAVAGGGEDGITTEDLLDALSRVPSTVNKEDLKAIAEFERSGSGPSRDAYVPTEGPRGDPSYV